jgi:serine protease Do
MRKNMSKALFLVFAIILLTTTACGSKTPAATQAPPEPTTAPAKPTEPPVPTDTAVPTGLVTNLTDLKKATVQIVAEGTFMDPEFGYMANQAGSGSGFIIDPSGLAVTNNHVVTGAALLKVYVGGDTTKSYNAKILGVSECSDLAVIDIEGDGFSYLPWHDGTANVGLEVYTAGFPLGDPEFTMTKGIVSKEKANGDTSWASVDSVIEHDATINPGNSGGPLVDADAKVVGVNYAGVSDTKQYFAIDRGTALSVIDQLKTGKDVESIGINGEAVYITEDGSLTGIWVSSVKSGSPADKSGVKSGDIITKLENLSMAQDGTMKDYCDVLRTRNATDTMAVEVLRWDTQEVLEGQLNGRPLAVSYVLGSSDTGATSTGEPSTDTGGTYPTNCESADTAGFMLCWDDTYNLSVEVPDYWTDVDGSKWNFNGTDIGYAVMAAPSLQDYRDYYGVEGMFFGASDTFAQIGGYVEFLDYYGEDYKANCTLVGRYDYNDGVYRGKYDLYTNCGGSEGYDTYLLSGVDIVDPTSKIIMVEVTILSTDTYIIDQIMGTFYVYF